MTKRKVIGTNKFVIYMYNGKNVRGKSIAKPDHFVYKQWGRIFLVDEDGNQIGNGYPFVNYGDMLSYINKIMSKNVRKNLKGRREEPEVEKKFSSRCFR